jgi:trimeric autotransporter adhesin
MDDDSHYDSDDGIEVHYASTVHAEHVAGYEDVQGIQPDRSVQEGQPFENINLELSNQNFLLSRGSSNPNHVINTSTTSNVPTYMFINHSRYLRDIYLFLAKHHIFIFKCSIMEILYYFTQSTNRPSRPSSRPIDHANILEDDHKFEEEVDDDGDDNVADFAYHDPPPDSSNIPLSSQQQVNLVPKKSMKDLFKKNHAAASDTKKKKREPGSDLLLSQKIHVKVSRTTLTTTSISSSASSVVAIETSNGAAMDRPMSWNKGSVFGASSAPCPPSTSSGGRKSLSIANKLKQRNLAASSSSSNITTTSSINQRLQHHKHHGTSSGASANKRPSFPPSAGAKVKLSAAMFATPSAFKQPSVINNPGGGITASASSTSTSTSTSSSSSSNTSKNENTILTSPLYQQTGSGFSPVLNAASSPSNTSFNMRLPFTQEQNIPNNAASSSDITTMTRHLEDSEAANEKDAKNLDESNKAGDESEDGLTNTSQYYVATPQPESKRTSANKGSGSGGLYASASAKSGFMSRSSVDGSNTTAVKWGGACVFKPSVSSDLGTEEEGRADSGGKKKRALSRTNQAAGPLLKQLQVLFLV